MFDEKELPDFYEHNGKTYYCTGRGPEGEKVYCCVEELSPEQQQLLDLQLQDLE